CAVGRIAKALEHLAMPIGDVVARDVLEVKYLARGRDEYPAGVTYQRGGIGDVLRANRSGMKRSALIGVLQHYQATCRRAARRLAGHLKSEQSTIFVESHRRDRRGHHRFRRD